jgi:hypothetical protein
MATLALRRVCCSQPGIVLNKPSRSQEKEQNETSIKRRKVLQSATHRSRRYFLTGDESLFYFTIDHDHISIPDGREVWIHPKQTIGSPKRMLTVFWSPLGFSFVEILPKEIHCDGRYFCSSILSMAGQNRPAATPEDTRRNMVLHFDNACPHTARLRTGYMRDS